MSTPNTSNSASKPSHPSAASAPPSEQLSEGTRESEAPFDARPLYPDETKVQPSTFRAIINFFRNVFSPIVEGARHALQAIRQAFGHTDQTAQALRNIRQAPAAPAGLPPSPHSVSPELQSELSAAAQIASEESHGAVSASQLSPSQVSPNQASPSDRAATPSKTDASDFAAYLADYKQDRLNRAESKTLVNQNFREGAVRHAQALFDAESLRCKAFAENPKTYFLAPDKKWEIKAAAELLGKPIPHPQAQKFGEKKEVSSWSPDQFSAFRSWDAWRKEPSKYVEFELQDALDYAHAYIADHNTAESNANPAYKQELDAAAELIAHQDRYARQLELASGMQLAQDILADLADFSAKENPLPTSPPPPALPPRVGAKPRPVETSTLPLDILSLEALSDAQLIRGNRLFDRLCEDFSRASTSTGGTVQLANYQTPECLAIANDTMQRLLGLVGDMTEVDLNRFSAATALINASRSRG